MKQDMLLIFAPPELDDNATSTQMDVEDLLEQHHQMRGATRGKSGKQCKQ